MDAMEQLEALYCKVHAPRPAPVAPPAPVDVAAAVRAELARQAAEEAEEARRAEAARWSMPEPCSFCGFSGLNGGERDPHTGKVTPWVWHTDRGVACSGCWAESHPFNSEYQLSDDEHRACVALKLLGPAAGGWVERYLLDRIGGFRWFCGVPDARPSDQTRFAYVDVAAMAAKLAPVPPDYRTAEACRVCGQTHRWVVQDEQTERMPVMNESDKVVGHRYQRTAAKLVCSPCRLVDRRGSQEIPLGPDGPARVEYVDPAPHPLADAKLWPVPVEGGGS